MTTETPKKHNQLKGRENYLAWVTRMEGLLSIDEVVARNPKKVNECFRTKTRYFLVNELVPKPAVKVNNR